MPETLDKFSFHSMTTIRPDFFRFRYWAQMKNKTYFPNSLHPITLCWFNSVSLFFQIVSTCFCRRELFLQCRTQNDLIFSRIWVIWSYALNVLKPKWTEGDTSFLHCSAPDLWCVCAFYFSVHAKSEGKYWIRPRNWSFLRKINCKHFMTRYLHRK